MLYSFIHSLEYGKDLLQSKAKKAEYKIKEDKKHKIKSKKTFKRKFYWTNTEIKDVCIVMVKKKKKSVTPVFPASAGRFFTTNVTWGECAWPQDLCLKIITSMHNQSVIITTVIPKGWISGTWFTLPMEPFVEGITRTPIFQRRKLKLKG